MSKRNKEPAMMRKTPSGDWVVSREWIGWYILKDDKPFEGVDAVLDVVAANAPAFVGASEGIIATVSRDGKAIVTFSEGIAEC